MKKVLLIAYACEPGKGSEPSVGWNWAIQISKFFETWVITRKSNQQAIENFINNKKINNLHFEYVDLPRWSLFWKKSEFSIRLYYMIWQFLALIKAKRLIKRVKFDIIHHITFLVDWLPPLAALLPGNFVWGPIGGTSREILIPFFKEFGLKNSIYEIFRSLYLNVFAILNPFIYLARKKSKLLILSINEDINKYGKRLRKKIEVFPAIGISPSELKCDSDKFSEFTIFTSGRMVHWKGFSIAIKAFHKFLQDFPEARMLIGGRGPEEKKLKKLVKNLDLQDKVKFLGFLPTREDVIQILGKSHVFLLPTLRDAPLVSFLEAMGCGVPIICIDIPSQRSVVCDNCGIRVHRTNPQKTVEALAESLKKIARDSKLREKMGKYGKEKVFETFSWDLKGEFIKKAYSKILGKL